MLSRYTDGQEILRAVLKQNMRGFNDIDDNKAGFSDRGSGAVSGDSGAIGIGRSDLYVIGVHVRLGDIKAASGRLRQRYLLVSIQLVR
jgi:hypothetical protein